MATPQASATLGRPRPRPGLAGRWRWSAARVVALVVLLNAIVAFLVFAAHAPWAAPAEEPAPMLPAQVRDLQERIAAGRHGEAYALEFSDAELTAAAGYYAATSGEVPFTRIRIAAVGDRVVVDAVTRGLAIPVPVRAMVALSTVDGVPRTRVEDVRVAGSGLPGFVRDQVLRQANESLDLSRRDLPLIVDEVQVSSGRVAIRGSLK